MIRSRTQTVALVVASMLAGASLLPLGAYAAQEVQAFITNDDAHSIPVHTVGTQTVSGTVDARLAAPAQPFVASADGVSSGVGTTVTALHVPAGKRAVLQYVAVEGSIARDATAKAWIEVTINGAQTFFTFHTRLQTRDGKYFGQDDWTGDGPVTIYADPDTDVKVTIQASASATMYLRASIAGYYQDL